MITDRSLITFKASVFLQKPTEAKKIGEKSIYFLQHLHCVIAMHLFTAQCRTWQSTENESTQTHSKQSSLSHTFCSVSRFTHRRWVDVLTTYNCTVTFLSQLTSIYLPLMWGNNNSQQTGGRARANTLSTAPSFKHTRSACFPTLGLRQPTCSHNFFC